MVGAEVRQAGLEEACGEVRRWQEMGTHHFTQLLVPKPQVVRRMHRTSCEPLSLGKIRGRRRAHCPVSWGDPGDTTQPVRAAGPADGASRPRRQRSSWSWHRACSCFLPSRAVTSASAHTGLGQLESPTHTLPRSHAPSLLWQVLCVPSWLLGNDAAQQLGLRSGSWPPCTASPATSELCPPGPDSARLSTSWVCSPRPALSLATASSSSGFRLCVTSREPAWPSCRAP